MVSCCGYNAGFAASALAVAVSDNRGGGRGDATGFVVLPHALAIEAGELTGTQYTDVYQQGRLAAAAATVLATGGVPATAFAQQSHLLMPYVIATKDNVGTIQPSQRW